MSPMLTPIELSEMFSLKFHTCNLNTQEDSCLLLHDLARISDHAQSAQETDAGFQTWSSVCLA